MGWGGAEPKGGPWGRSLLPAASQGGALVGRGGSVLPTDKGGPEGFPGHLRPEEQRHLPWVCLGTCLFLPPLHSSPLFTRTGTSLSQKSPFFYFPTLCRPPSPPPCAAQLFLIRKH